MIDRPLLIGFVLGFALRAMLVRLWAWWRVDRPLPAALRDRSY